MFTFEAGLSTGVVNQQSGEEAQDVFPVDFVGFQNLLQVTQQLLHAEDHSQLFQKHSNNADEPLLVHLKQTPSSRHVKVLNPHPVSHYKMCPFASSRVQQLTDRLMCTSCFCSKNIINNKSIYSIQCSHGRKAAQLKFEVI